MNNILLDEDHWKYIKRDGLDLVKLKCPKCLEWGDLEDHAIDEEGIINPSVICGNDPCDWHVMVALKNFKRKP